MAMGLAAFLLAFPSAKAGLLNNPQEKLIIVIERDFFSGLARRPISCQGGKKRAWGVQAFPAWRV